MEYPIEAFVMVPNPSTTMEASTSTFVVIDEHSSTLSAQEQVIYDVLKHMRSTLVSIFDALCLSPISLESLLKHGLAEVATKNGGAQAFFQLSEGIKDFVT